MPYNPPVIKLEDIPPVIKLEVRDDIPPVIRLEIPEVKMQIESTVIRAKPPKRPTGEPLPGCKCKVCQELRKLKSEDTIWEGIW